MKQRKRHFVLVAVLFAAISLQTTYSIAQWLPAAPTAGRYLYHIVSGIGTMVTYGQLLNQINKPSQEGSRLRARPTLHTFESRTESGVYKGNANSEWKVTHDDPWNHVGDRANYQWYNFSYFNVAWDEDDQEHYKVPYSETFGEGPAWISASQWRAAVDSPGAAKVKPFFWPWEDPWARPGFWIVSANSTKYEYPDVEIESDVWNPAWFGTTLDGELVDEAEELNLNYEVKVHFELQPLTWVEGPYGGHWQGGDWVRPNPNNYSLSFLGYEDSSASIALCPPNTRINGETVRGGMDIWWNKNVEYVYAKLKTQPLDSNGNPTGSIRVHKGNIQKNESWVVDSSVEPTSL
jgi:hypothetical protein